MNLSSLNGSNGFRLNGVAGDFSGFSVSNAGDVNGDGFDDLIIGALGADGGSGSSYVVYGKASGFSAEMDLSSLDGCKRGGREGKKQEGQFHWLVSLWRWPPLSLTPRSPMLYSKPLEDSDTKSAAFANFKTSQIRSSEFPI